MQKAFFYFLVALASFDLLFFEVRLSTLALLYAALHLQADGAAQRFLKEFVRKSFPHEDAKPAPPTEPAKVIPFRQASQNDKEAPRAKPTPKRPEPAAPQAEVIQLPKFGGRPHEVLGVSENAATRLIVKAFRKWIQQYHPDHAPPYARENATAHARQLNDAKEILLERRKRLRQNRVA